MKLRSPSLALLTAAAHASSPGGYYRGYPQNYPTYGESLQHQQQQPQQPPAIPQPWQEHVDPSSGRSYYYNPESAVTQWEMPDGTSAKNEENEVAESSIVEVGGDVVTTDANVTSSGGDEDMDPFSKAFAQGNGYDSVGKDSDTTAAGVSKEEDTQSPQDRSNRPAFGIGSYGMQQGHYDMQQYGLGMQGRQHWGQERQGQSWNENRVQQPSQQGEPAPDWNQQQQTQQAERSGDEKGPGQSTWEEGQPGPSWNENRSEQGEQGPAWIQQQQAQQVERSEQEKEPVQSTRNEGQPGQSWNERQGQQLPSQQGGQAPPAWNRQQHSQQVERNEQEKRPGQPMQQQSGSLPEWQSQQGRPAPHPPQQQQQPHPQQCPPQWQRQQHPSGHQHPSQPGQHNQPPIGSRPMRPGYGMPRHYPQQQQYYPHQQTQHGLPQRGPPSYGAYPAPHQHSYSPYANNAPPYGMGQSGPGTGDLVTQRTEELSSAVREKWGQALAGLGSFGNRTKELAETAKNQIGESASNAGKAIGETSTGIWGKLRTGIDQVKGSIFERNADGQGGGYALSQFGVPPPAGQGQRGPPPPGYGGRGYPPNYPPSGNFPPNNAGYPGQRQEFVPRPGYSPPYPHMGPQSQQPPPMQSQWGRGNMALRQGQGVPPMQHGRHQYPPNQQQQQGHPQYPPNQQQQQQQHGQQQYPPNQQHSHGQQQNLPNQAQQQQFPPRQGYKQSPPQEQQQQQHTNPANHPGWNH